MAWTSYKIHYRFRQTVYHITFIRLAADAPGPDRLFLDGRQLETPSLPMADDHHEHGVEMYFR